MHHGGIVKIVGQGPSKPIESHSISLFIWSRSHLSFLSFFFGNCFIFIFRPRQYFCRLLKQYALTSQSAFCLTVKNYGRVYAGVMSSYVG